VESQFDTTVVAAFEAVLASADEAYRTGQHPDFDLATQMSATTARALESPTHILSDREVVGYAS
jgi:hypothetical protein